MQSAEAVRELMRWLREAGDPTQALAGWCDVRGVGSGRVLAVRLTQTDPAPIAGELLAGLELEPGEVPHHRRLRFSRGEVPLADRDLWWLPGRLEPEMVVRLTTTASSFDAVVAPLRPHRVLLSETVLHPGGPHVLEHCSILLAGTAEDRAVAAQRDLYCAELVLPQALLTQQDADQRHHAFPLKGGHP